MTSEEGSDSLDVAEEPTFEDEEDEEDEEVGDDSSSFVSSASALQKTDEPRVHRQTQCFAAPAFAVLAAAPAATGSAVRSAAEHVGDGVLRVGTAFREKFVAPVAHATADATDGVAAAAAVALSGLAAAPGAVASAFEHAVTASASSTAALRPPRIECSAPSAADHWWLRPLGSGQPRAADDALAAARAAAAAAAEAAVEARALHARPAAVPHSLPRSGDVVVPRESVAALAMARVRAARVSAAAALRVARNAAGRWASAVRRELSFVADDWSATRREAPKLGASVAAAAAGVAWQKGVLRDAVFAVLSAFFLAAAVAALRAADRAAARQRAGNGRRLAPAGHRA